ncbi:hypothetical protein [Streptomyces sp. NPDC102476]|uniref:hypothetical protein n=1 Tax=Streptomyces sp. NPDC102476 TaxID=3366181 RepID=UPI0037FD1FEE
MNENKARVTQWWENLPPSAKQTLRDLDLQEGDRLPEEFVPGLEAHGIHPVKWVGGLGHVVPGEVVDLLSEQDDRNP